MLIDFKWRGAVVCKCLAFFARPTRITKVKYIKINKKYKARRSVRLRMFETCAMNERLGKRRCDDDDDSTGRAHIFPKSANAAKQTSFLIWDLVGCCSVLLLPIFVLYINKVTLALCQ